MLASYQFVPQKMNEQAIQKMGGGFRFKYKPAYYQKHDSQPKKAFKKNPTLQEKLTT